MKKHKRSKVLLHFFSILSLFCFVYINTMADSPETFVQNDLSEYHAVSSSIFPEVEIVMGIIRGIVDIITLT